MCIRISLSVRVITVGRRGVITVHAMWLCVRAVARPWLNSVMMYPYALLALRRGDSRARGVYDVRCDVQGRVRTV